MKRLFTILIILLFSTLSVLASTTGKIRGTITDASTGEPLIGVNVIVQGTVLGAATDVDGKYLILAVSPGVYQLRASMIGYETLIQTEVQVEVDRTIIIDFNLRPTEFQSAEVVITAERDEIRLDVSASETNLQASEINNLPFASRVENLVGMQAGVTGNLIEGDIRIREGTSDETDILIDGYSTADTKAGKVSFPVNKNSIQEIKVLRGGYNAEYGEARSGIINIVTKNPEDQFHAAVDYQFEPAGYRHDGADRYTPAINKMWPYVLYDGENSDNENFIVREEGIISDTIKWMGWNAYSDRLINDSDPGNDLTAEEARELWKWRHRPVEYGNRTGHNLDLSLSGGVNFLPWDLNLLAGFKYINRPYTYPQPKDSYEEIGYMLKAINRFGTNTTLTLSALNTTIHTVSRDEMNSRWSDEVKIAFDGGDSNPFYFFNKPYVNNIVNLYGLHLMQIFKPTLYLEADANYYRSSWNSKKFDQSPESAGRYFHGRLYYDPQSGHIPVELGYPDDVSGYRMFGRANTVDSSYTERYDVKVALINQFHPSHELKIGLGIRKTHLVQNRFHLHDDNADQIYLNQSDVSPLQFNAYVQDKIEFMGMVANVGLRFDYYTANDSLPDVQRTLEYATNLEVVNAFLDGTFPKIKPDAQMHVSPRVGISFPITTNSKVYFNYGHFVQMPQPEAMYFSTANIDYRLQWLGDPTLTFQKSINYELGYDQNIYDLFQLHVGVFYKDYSDVESGIVYAHSDQSIVLESAVQRENREIRGIDIEFRRSYGEWITGFLNFNITQKSTSDLRVPNISQIPVITDNPSIGIDGELRGVPRPLISEITPYGRGVITIRTPVNWGPRILDYPILHKTGFSFGLFYRGKEFTDAHLSDSFIDAHPDVKFYKIPYFSSNLRISRNFKISTLGDMELYLDISNLWVSHYRTAIPNWMHYYEDLYNNGKTDRVGSEDVADKNVLRTSSDVILAGQHRTYILGFRFNL
ncbi:MAG: carboxypeptidase-like regulatory domain-containing protein [Bacteroidota bacterium]